MQSVDVINTLFVYPTTWVRQKHDISEMVILLIQEVDNAQGLFSQIITLHRFYKLLEPHENKIIYQTQPSL